MTKKKKKKFFILKGKVNSRHLE